MTLSTSRREMFSPKQPIRLASILRCVVRAGMVATLFGCGDSPSAPNQSHLQALRLEVSPGSKTATLNVGDALQLQAHGIGDSGSDVPLEMNAITFVSRDPAMVAVDRKGIATLLGRGGAFIVAEAAGQNGPVRDSVHILYGTGSAASRTSRSMARR